MPKFFTLRDPYGRMWDTPLNTTPPVSRMEPGRVVEAQVNPDPIFLVEVDAPSRKEQTP